VVILYRPDGKLDVADDHAKILSHREGKLPERTVPRHLERLGAPGSIRWPANDVTNLVKISSGEERGKKIECLQGGDC